MHVLVTGGAGFVGRHVVRRLLERGDEVVCVDPIAPRTGGKDPAKGWPLFEPRDFRGFNYVKSDCRDWFAQNQGQYFDQAYHLAALVGGREVIEHDPLAVAEDLAIDAMYWRWAKDAKPGWTGCFSSSAAYPVKLQTKDNYRLLKEEDIDFTRDIGHPDLTYGWAKLTCEYIAKIAYEKHGLKSCSFRPFSGYGEDQDLAYPFPSIVKRVIDNKHSNSLHVWGSGLQMRDFVHIEDCVDLIILASQKISDSSAINISTGKLTSFIELMRMVGKEMKMDLEVQGMSDKPEGVFARGGDRVRQEKIGFLPKIPLDEGIRRAISYFESKA
jgi:nucleoside-diphosphate-sugar epimerase